jgi:NAD(P) transhydrogenase subunit alpha
MIIGVLKESLPETRVSILPEHVILLHKWNVAVFLEEGAGVHAYVSNEQYALAGAQVAPRKEVGSNADLILGINPMDPSDLGLISSKIILGVYQPLYNYSFMQSLADNNVTTFSIDMIPRTTRAQSMDVLSSQGNIAGYKAVVLAANLFPKYLPMFMTAAGSIPPAKVLILGAGVAGLQAIATARRLGAIVEVFDTRPAVKEEVMSLGAKYIEVAGAADAAGAGGYAVQQSEEFLQDQKMKIAESVAKSDIIITTAQIPGKKAPVLITEEMLRSMKEGSVIVDLAAATGGNTAATRNGETVHCGGVLIVGNSSLAATMPYDASRLYGKNILNFLQLMISKEGNLQMNFADDLVRGACIVHEGKIINEKVAVLTNQ